MKVSEIHADNTPRNKKTPFNYLKPKKAATSFNPVRIHHKKKKQNSTYNHAVVIWDTVKVIP